MAIEAKRGCGYRHVDGTYLVGGFESISCDRLPFPLSHCPVCGEGIHFTRAMTEINPLKLFKEHEDCKDLHRPYCFVCQPSEELSYIMMVGEKFYPTPGDFMREAHDQGISKRIPFIPKNLKLGETVVYLAHNKACLVALAPIEQAALMSVNLHETQARLVDAERKEKALGIFSAFVPQRIEKLFYKSQITDEIRESCAKRKITIVEVPDGDLDHAPSKKTKILE